MDLNGDGVIDSIEYDMVELLLLKLYKNGIYHSQIPYFGQENITDLVNQVSVELAFTMFMNDPRVPKETKEILLSTVDLDADGNITVVDFVIVNRFCIRWFQV